MPSGLDYLTVPRLSGIAKGLQDARATPGDLLFSSALPLTPAVDGEITALEVSRVLIADIIADNAAANVVKTGKIGLVTNNMASIKLGQTLTAAELIQLANISAGPSIPTVDNGVEGTDNEFLGDFVTRRVAHLRTALWNRLETIAVAMHLGTFSYDRAGMRITGATWGMPSDLQIAVSNAWSDTTNGDPANDIINANLYADTRYGKRYNRLTMSLPALRAMIACTKFQNLARMYLAPNVSYTNLPLGDIAYQKQMVSTVLGIDQIRVYSKRYTSWDIDTGRETDQPFLPLRQVILDSTENDNNASVQDIANGPTAESLVSSFMGGTPGGVIGRFSPNMRGPVAYATVKADLNPAELTLWASMRCWPRRRSALPNMVLDVGALTDSVPTSQPVLV